MVCYRILYGYQFVGVFFLAYTLVLLENYQLYLMICAGAEIEILGMRFQKIGYSNCSIKSSNPNTILTTQKKQQQNLLQLLECITMHKNLMKYVNCVMNSI